MSPVQVITVNMCPDRHGEKGVVGSTGDHRIMEGSKTTLGSSCPTIPPALPWSPLNYVPKCHTHSGAVTALGSLISA